MKFQVPRGTRDILPSEAEIWQRLEASARCVFHRYNYREIRTPIFESTDLFTRSVGESTDIVRKELYTFQDRKGRSLTLRPEGTAPVVRSFLEHAMATPWATRLYYMGPMFRYERPQAGRYRQFWQIGAELLGSASPIADAEMIDLFVSIIRDFGPETVTVQLNSLGDATCRPVYRERLKSYFSDHRAELCGDCVERLQTNPLRILDCKVPSCRPIINNAPSVLDSLCPQCLDHFSEVKSALSSLGIVFEVDPKLVRGLDYYTRTVFEVHAPGLGAQDAVGGGGRYDQLVKELGGPDTPAIGFSIGMERLVMASRTVHTVGAAYGDMEERPTVWIVSRTPKAGNEAISLAKIMRGEILARKGNLRVDFDVSARSESSQKKSANTLGAKWIILVPAEGKLYTVRNMSSGDEQTMELPSLVGWLLRQTNGSSQVSSLS